MSYEYEDELERMKKRRQQGRKQGNTSQKGQGSRKRPAESDFISSRQEEFENRKIRHSRAVRNRRRKKRIFLIVEIAALIILACVIFSVIKKKTDDGYWTIAVFGVDSRDGNLGKGALSDVEMLCNIDKKTGEVKIVSVFRDTYLKIGSDKYHKINEAYFKGGPKQAVSALEENLDLKIDNYATFNWKAVVDAINILGGVDVEISKAEFAYINSFITETVNSTGVGSYQLKSAGMNHLDGVQAVAYARLRLMDTDFNRTARQRKIVELAMEKAKNADWATRNNVLVSVFPQISTNIGIDDVIPMAKKLGDYHIIETTGFPFSRESKKIGKMDCVIPTTLESNVVQLHQLLFNDTNYSVPSSVKKISNKIAEDSGLKEVGENAAPAKTGGGSVPKQTQPAIPETSLESTEESSTDESAEETESLEESETEETISNKNLSDEENRNEDENVGPGSGLKPSESTAPSESSDKKPTDSGISGDGSENSITNSNKPESRPSESPKPASGEKPDSPAENLPGNNSSNENEPGSGLTSDGPGNGL